MIFIPVEVAGLIKTKVNMYQLNAIQKNGNILPLLSGPNYEVIHHLEIAIEKHLGIRDLRVVGEVDVNVRPSFEHEFPEENLKVNDPYKIQYWGPKVYRCPKCSKLNHLNDGNHCMACKTRLTGVDVINNPFL